MTFLKKLEVNLLINRPDIWFTRILYVLPLSIGGLMAGIMLGSYLPMTSNMVSVVIVMSIVALAVIFFWYRLQFLYYDKTLGPKQLFRIFLINLTGITVLTWSVIIIPNIMGKRIDLVFENSQFLKEAQDIRLAMIPQQDLNLIRDGKLEQRYLDSLYGEYLKGNDLYPNVSEQVYNLKDNKFYQQGFTDLDLSLGPGVSASSDSAVATQVVPDTSMVTDTSRQLKVDSGTRQYSDFENYIRGLTGEQIFAIKANANRVLERYDFSIYHGDSSSADLNRYFATLNRESLNLYNSKSFLNEFTYILIFYCVFIFTQFLMTLLGKYDLPVTILSFAFMVGNMLILVSLILVPYGAGDPEWTRYYLVLMGFLIVPALIISGIFRKKASINRLRLFLLQYLTLSMPLYAAVALLFLFDSVFRFLDLGNEWQIVVFFATICAISLYFNYLFYKRYHYILNLPRA